MILLKSEAKTEVKGGSHDGAGQVTRTRLLGDYDRAGPGFRFVHDNVLEPGTTIGEHTHRGTEELWLVLEGRAEVVVDGRAARLGPGDGCLVRDGGTHRLTASGDAPVHMLVIATGV